VSALADRKDSAEIRLLGPFDVVRNGWSVALGTRKQRAVLALLALEPNSAVSTARLIDALWGDEPPASARAVLQTYVAGLRRSLDGTGIALETRGSGYALEIDAATVDSERFRALVAEARQHADRGEREAAADKLRTALALWRGRPLEEFGSEPGLADAAERLEEQRVDVTEERIEADLSVGATGALVDELYALVDEHPYRERLRGQLMRALYLAGRQGAALEVYRDARRMLADDLGVEPGPELRRLERRILEQDPGLSPAAPAAVPDDDVQPRDVPGRSGPSRRLRVGLAAAAAALLTVASVVLLTRGGAEALMVPANSVALIDPATNAVVYTVPVGIRPGPVFGTTTALWVGNLNDRTLTAIDIHSREITGTFTLDNRTPDALAVDHGIAWVVHGRLGQISFLDAQFGATWAVHDVAGRAPYAPTGAIALAGRWGWAAFGDSTLARLRNPGGASTGTTLAGNSPVGVAVGYRSVWVANSGDATVQRFDPETFQTGPIKTFTVASRPGGIAIGEGGVWVTSTGDDLVTRIDPSGSSTFQIEVGDAPTAVAVGEDAVWVANTGDSTISRIDPGTADVVATIELGNPPAGIAVAGGFVWVAVQAP
jgi:YVTN family beta-propeller protein